MGNDRHIVSVVVPTMGRDTITFCREALAGQTRVPDEVIIVMDKDRRGPSWARNEGIRRSRGDLIAFTDDDCIPPPNWLERCRRSRGVIPGDGLAPPCKTSPPGVSGDGASRYDGMGRKRRQHDVQAFLARGMSRT